MPRANDIELKKVENEASLEFSKPSASSLTSQGEVSVYEIDILSYGSSSDKNKLVACENGKNWRVELKKPGLVIEHTPSQEEDESKDVGILFNPFIQSHYPLLYATKSEPDVESVSLEIKPEENHTENVTNYKVKFKEKPLDKNCSPSDTEQPKSSLSEEKFKTELKKLIIEDFIAENDDKVGKVKNSIKSVKNSKNEPIHLHHHEHHHRHHYYFSSFKHRNNQNVLKTVSPSDTKNVSDETEQKKEGKHENSENVAVNAPKAATFFCDQSPGLVLPVINDPTLTNCNNQLAEKSNCLSMSSSIDSLLGAKSDLVATQTFSQTQLSRYGSEDCRIEGEVHEKKVNELDTKALPKLTPKKLLKPEYVKIMESLKVLDKYLEPKTITKAKAKVSYIKCACQSETEDETENSGERLETFESKRSSDEICNQDTMKTTSSDKNRYASHFCVKRSNESLKLKTVPHHVWAKHLKQELREIKERLRNLEELYSKNRKKSLTICLRGNDLGQEVISKEEISVFSTKTYILKGNKKFYEGSSICWI